VLRRVPWLLALVLVSACQAEATVGVAVEEDGSGEVTVVLVLDPEASEKLLDLDLDDGTGLALDDLAQSDWVVSPPTRREDGSTEVIATKMFGTPEQFSEVMAELSGPDGLFQDFALVRRQRFAQVDYEITGSVDPSGGFDSLADSDLEEALGRPVSSIASTYLAEPGAVSINVVLSIPGQVRDEPPAGLIPSDADVLRARWQTDLAADDPVPIALRSVTRQVAALALRGVSVVAGVLAAIMVFAQLLRILRPDRRRSGPPRRSGGVPARRSPSPAPEPVEELAGPVPQRVLALDGMGVLYREPDEVGNVLIPFARERGSSVPDEEIAARARALRLGRLTTAEFWSAIAVPGHPDSLDTAYLSRHQLTPGVIKYLRAQRDKGLRVACITNDAPTWAYKLRAGHSLEGLIDPWVISGSVGVGKPDRPIFEVLRRVTGEPPSAILIIDDDLDVLDAARRLGFATMWFAPDGDRERARGHRFIRGFGSVATTGAADAVVSTNRVLSAEPD
jgi:putative hydrolase of the HAD superfamily